MPDQDLLLQALRSFAVTMGGDYDLTEMSYQLFERTVEVLSATGAWVSVSDDHGDLRFVVATSDTIVQMEHAQEDAHEGPCILAFDSQQPVAISNLDEMHKWPAYCRVAEQLGLNAVVGHPLSVQGDRLGALNVYNADVRELD